MKNIEFLALVIEENDGVFTRSFQKRNVSDLPKGDVLIKVHYSTLNYKDGLSARGHKGITRKYPHTPGVDASGIVEFSSNSNFKIGDEVMVTGYDLGMNTSGGFAEYISVPADWVLHLPEGMDLRTAMIYGTAGLTAAICINEIESRKITPKEGSALVTGSTGGVGFLAVGMLANLGYNVIASTGKLDKNEMLTNLGANEIISREDVNDKSNKPLLPKRWIAAIDTVGGNTLSTVIRSTDHHGAICALGLVESDKLDLTIYPFILRGVALIGIDSAEKDIELKRYLWNRINSDLKIKNIENYVKEVSLLEINQEIELILQGKQFGKVLVNCKDI